MASRSFRDLRVWQSAEDLTAAVYDAVKAFPAYEQFGLSSQLRRSVISVPSNIAEGFGRSTAKDREHFYTMANGSLYEVKNQLIIARDRKYLKQDQFSIIADQANCAHRLLHGLLRAHKR